MQQDGKIDGDDAGNNSGGDDAGNNNEVEDMTTSDVQRNTDEDSAAAADVPTMDTTVV